MPKSTAEIRFYWPPELHQALKAIAEIEGVCHNALAERYVTEQVQKRIHDAMLLATRTDRLGIVRKVSEANGKNGK